MHEGLNGWIRTLIPQHLWCPAGYSGAHLRIQEVSLHRALHPTSAPQRQPESLRRSSLRLLHQRVGQYFGLAGRDAK